MDASLFIEPQIARASTLPSRFYTDPALFELGRDRIFARSWQFAGDTDGLRAPGTVLPWTLLEGTLDEPLVWTRDMADRLHLLSNVCPHRGMTVAESRGNARFLRCRYHGRRFGLDGEFQHMPEFDGVEGFPGPCDGLVEVPHGFWHKLAFASLAPRGSLEETLAPMTDRLAWLPLNEFVYRPEFGREYLVRANWALYVDNYLEGFHIPFIHAGLNEVLDYGRYETETFATGNLQLATAADGEDAFDLPAHSPDSGQRISAYYYWFFPNLMFNFYPWGLSINVVRPLGLDVTKVHFLPYVWREERRGRGAGADLDRVEREDEVVVEAVQRGLRSRFYDRGRYSVLREGNVHHFHRLIAESMSRP